MDYVLLSPEEAGELACLPRDEVISMVEAGELGGLRVAGQWRIPLKSVAQLLGTAHSRESLDELFNDHELWDRIFASHPEVSRSPDPSGSAIGGVMAYLRRAVSQARDE